MLHSVSGALIPPLLEISATSPHPSEWCFHKRHHEHSTAVDSNCRLHTALVAIFHTRRGITIGRTLCKTVLRRVVVEEYNLIREDTSLGIAIYRDMRHFTGYRYKGKQRIRTPSIGNTANFQEGLLSAQWVLHEPSRSLRR